MTYSDDPIALANWCSLGSYDERPEVEAAVMPPAADREALRMLLANKPHLGRRPTRLADLLEQQGVVMTPEQVMKSMSDDAGDIDFALWAPR